MNSTPWLASSALFFVRERWFERAWSLQLIHCLNLTEASLPFISDLINPRFLQLLLRSCDTTRSNDVQLFVTASIIPLTFIRPTERSRSQGLALHRKLILLTVVNLLGVSRKYEIWTCSCSFTCHLLKALYILSTSLDMSISSYWATCLVLCLLCPYFLHKILILLFLNQKPIKLSLILFWICFAGRNIAFEKLSSFWQGSSITKWVWIVSFWSLWLLNGILWTTFHVIPCILICRQTSIKSFKAWLMWTIPFLLTFVLNFLGHHFRCLLIFCHCKAFTVLFTMSTLLRLTP